MVDFFIAALPWIATGLAIAVAMANSKDEKTDWLGIGISLRMLCGITVSRIFSFVSLEFGISFGMLAGVIIGVLRKERGRRQE